jgi:hypothetical protein
MLKLFHTDQIYREQSSVDPLFVEFTGFVIL